jgi:VanZ family protein
MQTLQMILRVTMVLSVMHVRHTNERRQNDVSSNLSWDVHGFQRHRKVKNPQVRIIIKNNNNK